VLPQFTLYGRSYCHLCDEMLAALEVLCAEHPFAVTMVDVDTDPTLEMRYNVLVPVLVANGTELCHHFLDVPKVREYLTQFR